MIELTAEQRRAVAVGGNELLRAIDPETQNTYVLVPEAIYQRVKGLFGDEDYAGDIYHQAMEVFGREGWDDPAMDVYDDLDPRKQP